MIRFLCSFLILISSTAGAAELCEIVIDPQNPRRVDIQFPGKLITVIGHQHPRRGDAKEKRPGFENYLWSKFLRIEALGDPKKIKKEINEYRRLDDGALKHWNEDRETVEKAMRDRSHQNFAIEMKYADLKTYQFHGYDLLMKSQIAAEKLNLTEEELTSLQTIALSAPLLTRYKNAQWMGETRMITAEPSDEQAAEYDAAYCPKKEAEEGSAIHPEKQKAMVAFLTSLKKRGISEKAIDEGFNRASSEMDKLMAKLPISQLTDPKALNQFKIYSTAFRMPLTRDEIQNLKFFFTRSLEPTKGFESVNPSSIIANLPRMIEEYNGCWGRDALIAKSLASQRKSTMMLIGIGHLAPQAALLKRECLQQLPQPVPIFEPATATR